MLYLNRLFSGRALKTLLVISVFILTAVAIWYLGPFVGFGKTRPFASIEARVVFILLAMLWLATFWWAIPAFVMVALTLCAIVWEIGPFILTGESYPLVSITNRLIVIAIIVIVTLAYAAWRLLLALSVNPNLLENLTRFRKAKAVPEEDLSEITAVIRDAVTWTEKMHQGVPKWRRFFMNGGWRSEQPWYMLLGAKSAGKTSIIASSGQDFPLPEQLSRVGTEAQPTNNCECWFANDALFIDTAGKYIDDSKGSQSEWRGLLKAIVKYRPVKAINGVIVAISTVDILETNKNGLMDLAVTIRGRLNDVRTELGVRFPVYVVITKLDRLSGFDEYFRNLTSEGREQIWGVTFPYGVRDKNSVDELQNSIKQELKLLEERIDNNLNMRQQEEYAVADRKKMYALPQDFRILSEGVVEVLQNIFFASRYDETQFYSTLRGIYFVSSRQSHEKPMDNPTTLIQRWRKYLSEKQRLNDAPLTAANSEGDGQLISDIVGGKHFFLKKLFSEIIIKDADLVRYNLDMESKFRLRNFFGHCACIIAAIWLLNSLISSYGNNSRYLDVVGERLQTLERNSSIFVRTANEKLLPTLLSASQKLPGFGMLNILNPEWSYRYGLYVGKDVNEYSDSLYQVLLHKYLLPLIEEQASRSLQQSLLDGNSTNVFDSLKLYLVIFGEGKFNKNYVVDSVTQQWEITGKIQPYEDNSVFINHLNSLFSQPDWRRNGGKIDSELVKQARLFLADQSATTRLYGRVKSILQTEAPGNLTLRQLVGEDAGQIFKQTDSELMDSGIPGLFTYDGYHNVFKKKVIFLVTSLWDEDSWVMGLKSEQRINPLTMKDEVLKRYLTEYRNYWTRFLANIHLITSGSNSLPGLSVDIYMLRTLASSTSPLISLAKNAVKQTTLSVQEAKLPTEEIANDLHIGSSSQLLNSAKKVNTAMAFQEKKLLAEGVDNYFSALRAFVSGMTTPDAQGGMPTSGVPGTQLSKMLGLLSDQYTLFVVSNSAISDGDIPTMSDSGKKLAAESQTWPDPFREIVAPLLSSAYKKIDTQISTQIVATSKKTIESGIGDVCRTTIAGRYPFADSAQEVSLSDFERFFAAGGVVDSYFTKNLAEKVDTSVSPWIYKGTSSSDGLALFEQAAIIRNAFFQGSEAKTLSLRLSLSIPYMSPSITQLTLNPENERFKYSHGPVTPLFFSWPGSQSGVAFSAMPRISSAQSGWPFGGVDEGSLRSPVLIKGPWALFRWFDKADQNINAGAGKKVFTYYLDKRRVDVEVSGLIYGNKPILNLLRDFTCPSSV